VLNQLTLDFQSLAAVSRVAANFGSEPKEDITIIGIISAVRNDFRLWMIFESTREWLDQRFWNIL
jgi:hypothetical protein